MSTEPANTPHPPLLPRTAAFNCGRTACTAAYVGGWLTLVLILAAWAISLRWTLSIEGKHVHLVPAAHNPTATRQALRSSAFVFQRLGTVGVGANQLHTDTQGLEGWGPWQPGWSLDTPHAVAMHTPNSRAWLTEPASYHHPLRWSWPIAGDARRARGELFSAFLGTLAVHAQRDASTGSWRAAAAIPHWLALLMATPTMLLWRSRRRRAARFGRCTRCNYPITSLPPRVPCPECGTPRS